MIQEEFGLPHKIKVVISRDLGQDELVVGLEVLKTWASCIMNFLEHCQKKGEKIQNRSMCSTTA